MDNILRSKDIIDRAIKEYQPRAIFMMFSGGNDSRCAYAVSQLLNVPLTHFIHGITGTGILGTTEYAQQIASQSGLSYIEADSGNAYEKYVLSKGFFGRGLTAHSYAYHILKATVFRKAGSSVRKRRRNFNILFINGARLEESSNRSKNLKHTTNIDPGAKRNVWVNIIHHWTRQERDEFLADCNVPINPVTEVLCRSGECMCGTMQSQEERQEAAYWYPDWGNWLDNLERHVMRKFNWRWGEDTSRNNERLKNVFMPACMSCTRGLEKDE